MKKIHAFVFILLILVSIQSIQAQFVFPKTGADLIIFKAECSKRAVAGVKYRYDTKVPVSNTGGLSNEYVERMIKFNDDGSPSDMELYNSTGLKQYIMVYQYTKAGFLQRETKFEPTGVIQNRTDYRYDVKNRLLLKCEYDQFEYVISKTIFHYDDKERTIREYEFSAPDMISRSMLYLYSDLDGGTLTGMIEFIGESTPKFKTLFTYSGATISAQEVFNASGKKLYTLNYLYDSYGQLLKITCRFGDGKEVDMHTYKYDDRGLMIAESESDLYGKLRKCYKYRYE